MSGTKIVVLQSRKIIYSLILIGLGILALVFVIMMFLPKQDGGGTASVWDQAEQEYEAGVYTKEIRIGDAMINLQLSLDENNVKSIELVNLDESVETMYPLMAPTVEKISEQLAAGRSMEEIVGSEDAQYTEKLIVETVSAMMEEHRKQEE